jgi:ABC-type multidrug transport system ATPase subunit
MRLVVENVSKEYRGDAQGVRALSNVGFSLGPGVLGLLGCGCSACVRDTMSNHSVKKLRSVPVWLGL